MTTRTNRDGSPAPYQVRFRRSALKLSSKVAGDLVHVPGDLWIKWENGHSPMSPTAWELFRLKTRRTAPFVPAFPRPTPEIIRQTRIDNGLRQADAAPLVYVVEGTWSAWERGLHPMPLVEWELFEARLVSGVALVGMEKEKA